MDGFWSRVSVVGLLLLSLVATSSSYSYMCPMCTCPAFYKPVCGYRWIRTEEGFKPSFRTFSQSCELDCQNKCRLDRYTRFHDGRCSTTETTNQFKRLKARVHQRRKLPMNG